MLRIITNLLLIWLWIMHEVYPSEAQQVTCRNRPAIPFDAAFLAKLPREWFVARATLRTVLPRGVPEPTINSCAPLSYLQTCQGGMRVENDWDKDGGVIRITKAYSYKYDNIVEYWQTQRLDETGFFVYSGFGTSMTLHFRDGNWQDIPTYDFPDMVIYAQAQSYAMTVYGYLTATKEIEWVMYEACNEDFAWIEIAQWVVKANRLHEVNQVIDNYLALHTGIPPMVKLIPVLPFRV